MVFLMVAKQKNARRSYKYRGPINTGFHSANVILYYDRDGHKPKQKDHRVRMSDDLSRERGEREREGERGEIKREELR